MTKTKTQPRQIGRDSDRSRATPGSGWIASVPPDEATGLLAEAYAKQIAKIGRVSELTQIGSLYPALVAERLALYQVVDATPSDVPEWVRRAVALLTSVLNGCLHCTVGNTQKLVEAGYGPLADAIKAAPRQHSTGDLRIDAIFAYTRKLVLDPAGIVEGDVVALQDAGWSDLDILDVNNIAAYYCYINRVAHGLGLQGEA
jgi:uncharacterized peroxidase-related enzyme